MLKISNIRIFSFMRGTIATILVTKDNRLIINNILNQVSLPQAGSG